MPTLAPPRPAAARTGDAPPRRPRASSSSTRLLQDAIREGQELYFERCRERVPGFVARHMSLRGAARRYYPPRPLEILRLALSVMVTPVLALVQLALWAARRDQHPAWLTIKATIQRLTLPRAHEALARRVQSEVFADDDTHDPDSLHELERCVVASPSFAAYLRAAMRERHPNMGPGEIEPAADRLATALMQETPGTGPAGEPALPLHARDAIRDARVHGDLEAVVAGEAARADVVNTILTGVVAKVTLGQLKLGAYGIALLIAPPLHFRWSSGREEKVRRAIDGLLPDGPFSLSRAGWNFDWTDSFESFALMAGLFLAVSAALSVIGYLLAPLLSPLWRMTGLPAYSLRRTVEASRRKVIDGRDRQSLSPEVFAAKLGDVAELFLRSG